MTSSMDPATCQHENFEAAVDVHRLADVGAFTCDVRVRCAQCGTPFHFIGPPLGVYLKQPSTSLDGTELRCPIAPGMRDIPASGSARFEVPLPPDEEDRH